MEREQDQRVQNILQRREELLPLLHPDRILNTTEAEQRIRKLLEPFERSIHAQLTDIVTHPADCLIADKKGKYFQFVISGSQPDECTYVRLDSQDIKADGKRERLVKKALFVESDQSTLIEMQKVQMKTTEQINIFFGQLNICVYSMNMPYKWKYLSCILFDKKGKISDIYHADTKRAVWYRLSGMPEGYSAERNGSVYYMYSRGLRYYYFFQQDRGFYRSIDSKGGFVTLEEEIAAALAELPFEDITLHGQHQSYPGK